MRKVAQYLLTYIFEEIFSDMNVVPSFPELLKNLSKIHVSMLIGQIILILICFNFPAQQTSFEGGVFVFPLFFAAAFGVPFLLQMQALKKAKMEINLKEKILSYRAVLIMRFAMIEAPFLFSIVINFVTGEKMLVALSIALSVYFYTLKPSRERIVKDLQLTSQEELDLDKLS